MSTRTTTVRDSGAATSARFEARAGAAGWGAGRPLLVAIAVGVLLVVLAALAALAYAGPLLVVRSVEVTGVRGADARLVQRAVGPVEGTPLARLDVAAVADRVD